MTESTIVIVTENGQQHQLDSLYPALGCVVRSELATALGAVCNENGNLIVDDYSGRQSIACTQLGTSSRT